MIESSTVNRNDETAVCILHMCLFNSNFIAKAAEAKKAAAEKKKADAAAAKKSAPAPVEKKEAPAPAPAPKPEPAPEPAPAPKPEPVVEAKKEEGEIGFCVLYHRYLHYKSYLTHSPLSI